MGIKLAMIGAGNLGTRLSLEFHNKGIEIIQLYNRSLTPALTLGKLIGCSYVTKTEDITNKADIYIVSVSDLAISDLLSTINFNNKIIVHTAGSIPMEVLKNFSNNYGVFYPLQTFSKYRDVDFSQVPILIEANTTANQQVITDLASLISNDVRILSSKQRKQLHLAAVFACNFTNHMYSIAAELVKQNDLPFDILIPLITETASKIKNITPPDAQTGPAVRNDKNIINEHLKMLDLDPGLRKIYKLLSESIYELHKK